MTEPETVTVRKDDLPWPPWLENLSSEEKIRAIVGAVAACHAAHDGQDPPGLHEQHCTVTMAEHFLVKLAGEIAVAGRQLGSQPDGQWLTIAFFGRIEHTGYVTEVTRNGQAAYHIDLPGKVWGGNPLDWVEYAASSWFSEQPVRPESVRKAWEAQQQRIAARLRQEAEWERQQAARALPAGSDDPDGTAEDGWADDRDEGPF